MQSINRLRQIALFAFALMLSACSLNRKAAHITAGIITEGLDSVFSQSDTEYVKAALPANLQMLEILISADSNNKTLLVNTAMGFGGYALMFLEDIDNARASGFYQKCYNYADKALKGKALGKLKPKDAPALFWRTFCKAGYINLNKHSPKALADISSLEPAIARLEQLDPKYYYNGVYALKGAYFAMRPRILGGKPEKAGEYFEKALEGEGADFLMTKLEYAKTAAIATLNEALFDKLLNEIINAPKFPGPKRLANETARLKAKQLLEKKDEFF